jgi:phosphinothricin acetyltransferase
VRGQLICGDRVIPGDRQREEAAVQPLGECLVHEAANIVSAVHIRDATTGDLDAIRDLYNALIPTTTVAWRDAVASRRELDEWFAERRLATEPVLVAEVDGEVVGYTCWSTFRGGPRFPGYRHTVELTIHVRGDQHGQGVGRHLIAALMDAAKARDIHVLVAGIDADNEASIEFHRKLGFDEVARMPEVGRKFDRWLDLVLMQKIVDPSDPSQPAASAAP